MGKFLDRLNYFKKTFDKKHETFSNEHGIITDENRDWENSYRSRWSYDKMVRSTHGVNCTGSCSWKIYVKNGVVTWETQQTDYPETRPDLPNHEPRGCGRGASYSWYLYSANRVKYPMIRRRLLELWRIEREKTDNPVEAWANVQSNHDNVRSYQLERGNGGLVRASWDEVTEIIAASNLYTAEKWGPDRIVGFSPIPAMSMVSYAAGSRYLSLMGGTCMSFYDWYCDLPPSSPQTWGEQTDVPESADWYNSSYLMMWGSNVPMTRTPDAHFMTEVRYKGTKVVTVTSDFSEASKFADHWLAPRQGTDNALALAMGHVIANEFLEGDKKSDYFVNYLKHYSDLPFLVKIEKNEDGKLVSGRMLRANDVKEFAKEENSDWKTLLIDEKTNKLVVPNGTIGSRWEKKGKWNLETKDANTGAEIDPKLSFIGEEVASVAFPYFGNIKDAFFEGTNHDSIMERNIPVRKIKGADGKDIMVATAYDLFIANYGVDRGLGGENVATDYNQDAPFTPKWQEQITGVNSEQVIKIAREFAETAHKTQGKAMVIIGAALNHWYHADMNYRSIINMLVMCGCIGVSGGGWSHYVGQEKLRPQTGWVPLAFATDWSRPPRHMNSTSFWYMHTDQWRYETVDVKGLLSPLVKPNESNSATLLDHNIRAERMGWLPSSPTFNKNPIQVGAEAKAKGMEAKDYVVQSLQDGSLEFAHQRPDAPETFPRNLFVWRSNLLGSSGKGHEYFLKHLLGTHHGVIGNETVKDKVPSEITMTDKGPEGKLDLLVTLDFRMSSTAIHSDIVLPAASWYEKEDINTSDMHPFIHPLSRAIDPVWESKSDWDIFKTLAAKVSEISEKHNVLTDATDVVGLPTLHDTPTEISQGMVKDWKKGEIDPIPGKTMPNFIPVERDYRRIHDKFTSVGPLLDKLGAGGKGIDWKVEEGLHNLSLRNHKYDSRDGEFKDGRTKIDTAVDAIEFILGLAPETNGEVAHSSWEALGKITGRDHTHLVDGIRHNSMSYKDLQAQPRKINSSPTWSGIESEEVSYTAGWTNVNELIPWRTLTGRQQLYQDHEWMLNFGEQLCVYKAPIDTNAFKNVDTKDGLVLNFLTPHQKWGIHSTYNDNLYMLTLSRGGPCIWISEIDAQKGNIKDNDWIEAQNDNGAVTARAIVSQRIPSGMALMYHAQEKTVYTPRSPSNDSRGIHNSVSRAVIKPTHMVGGYAQLAYGFNYYGTIGTNRDEMVLVKRVDNPQFNT